MLDPRSEDFPRGWYVVAHVDELPENQPLATKVLGREVLILRDDEGKPHIISRHCPHRGADLMLGEVKGSTIECRLHNRCFAMAPQSRKTRQLDTWPCVERNMSIYMWHCPHGSEPTWEPEDLLSSREFYPWLGAAGVVAATVQDLSEGVVDIEHFSCIHEEVVENYEISTKGHKLFANYTMRINHGWVKGLRYTVHLTETGPALTYGFVTVHFPVIKAPNLWINVAKTPVDKDSTKVWGCISTPRQILPTRGLWKLLSPLLNPLVSNFYRWFSHVRFQKTFQEDVVFFKDRVWVDPSTVVGNNEGDHYVREHAQWYKQFA